MHRVLLAFGLPWVLAVTVGFFALYRYAVTPGQAADAPGAWPSDTRVPLDPALPTLVMVVHPRCSCTRASVAELSRLMTRLHGRVTAQVLFVLPHGVDAERWRGTDLWTGAARIDGVHVLADDDGREAARFGALTSGQVYLYAPNGRLEFSGGITPSRAHEGASVGSDRVIDLVTTGRASGHASAVYGCAIKGPSNEGSPLLSSIP